MHRVVLECLGVPADQGKQAADDIQQEFRDHRPYHQNAQCTFADGLLVLQAENDFDPFGLALTDELSDCICAYTTADFDFELRLVSSTAM